MCILAEFAYPRILLSSYSSHCPSVVRQSFPHKPSFQLLTSGNFVRERHNVYSHLSVQSLRQFLSSWTNKLSSLPPFRPPLSSGQICKLATAQSSKNKLFHVFTSGKTAQNLAPEMFVNFGLNFHTLLCVLEKRYLYYVQVTLI